MNIRLLELRLRTRQKTEVISFSPTVTFIHGPVGTGKSTVARLIDYCFGGDLAPTMAMQKEFVAVELSATLERNTVVLERGAGENASVRVTWSSKDGESESVNAPIHAVSASIYGDDVFSLSDLVFKLCGVQPMKVRRSKLDPDSPLVRLGIRDLMWYCYLEQEGLDSSFFGMEHPFKKLKSRDAMRFFTGLHSEQLSQLEDDYNRAVSEQRAKREAVEQVRTFMAEYKFGTESEILNQQSEAAMGLKVAVARRDELDRTRKSQTHEVEPLRDRLREIATLISATKQALADIELQLLQKQALRAELITAKTKASRADQAGRVLPGASFELCPQCGSSLSGQPSLPEACSLCGHATAADSSASPVEQEAYRRDVNDRIDELADSVARHKREKSRTDRRLAQLEATSRDLDSQLSSELAKYDTAFVSTIRAADRDVARFQERIDQLERLKNLPRAIAALQHEAGEMQGRIDVIRAKRDEERERLQAADEIIKRIASRFFDIMRAVGFPGVEAEDRVVIDPRNWEPVVEHGGDTWGFETAGSGGKKTLFNVCYALAIHAVAAEEGLPIPNFLIIDSPTKNISKDENPELVKSLYREIYALAARSGRAVQFLLIDSDLVSPASDFPEFRERRMSGDPGEPKLISYYNGP